MDANHRTVVDPEYDVIHLLHAGRVDDPIRNEHSYLEVIKNGKRGIIDANNKIIVPIEYNYAGISYASFDCERKNPIFTVQNSNHDYGCLNKNGEEVVPFIYDAIFLRYSQRYHCDDSIIIMAICTLGSNVVMHNISNGKKSDRYYYIHYFEGLGIATKGDKAWVLDENLNEIAPLRHGEYLNPTLFKWKGNNYLNTYAWNNSLRRYDSLMFTEKKLTTKRKFGKTRIVESPQIWMENYRNDKYIEHAFNQVQVMRHPSRDFVWAYDFTKPAQSHYRFNHYENEFDLSIYSKSLDSLAHYTVKETVNWNTQFIDYIHDTIGVHFFKNNDDKYGAIDNSGTIVVPFVYDRCEYRRLWTDPYTRNYVQSIVVSQNGKSGLLNLKGEVIVPLIYDDFVDRKGIIGDSSYSFYAPGLPYNAQLTKQKKVKSKKYHPKKKKNKKKKKVKHNYPRSPKEEYRVVDDTLFFYQGFEYTSKCDTSFFRFESPMTWHSTEGYIVNEEGKIIYEGQQFMYDEYNGYALMKTPDHLFVIDSLGNIDSTEFTSKNFYYEFDGTEDQLLYVENYKYRKIRRKNYQGLYDLKKQKWIFTPHQYYYITPTPFGTDRVYWVNDYHKKKNRFYLVDSDNKKLLPFAMDYPGSYNENSKTTIYEINGLQGLLDSNYQIILPADSVILYEFDKFIGITDARNKYPKTLFNGSKHLDKGFDQTLWPTGPNATVLKRGEQYAIIDSNLDYTEEYQSAEELLSHVDLYKTLGIEGTTYDSIYLPISSFMENENELAVRNALIWRDFNKDRFDRTLPRDSIIVFTHANKRIRDTVFGHITRNIRTIQSFLVGNYFSEQIILDTIVWIENPTKKTKRTRTYWNQDIRWSYTNVVFRTYKIEDKKLIEVNLNDILISNKEEQLDQLMIKKLNDMQAFGFVCIDLQAELEGLKKNFQLKEFEISFKDPKGKYVISIQYSELECLKL